MYVEFMAGTDIGEAIEQASRIAKVVEQSVEFSHNGVPVRVDAYDDLAVIEARWQEDFGTSLRVASGRAARGAVEEDGAVVVRIGVAGAYGAGGKSAEAVPSARELEVGRLVAEGLTSVEIGERLCISPRTVEKHRANLMDKLGVGNAAALVAKLFA